MRIALLILAVGEKAIMINLNEEPELKKAIKIKAEDILRPSSKLVLKKLRLRRNDYYNLVLKETSGIRYYQDTKEDLPAFIAEISEMPKIDSE